MHFKKVLQMLPQQESIDYKCKCHRLQNVSYLEAAHHSMCLQSFISLQHVSSSVVLKPYGPEQTSSGVKCVTLRLYVATVGLQIFRTFIFPVHQDTPCISVGTQVEHNLQIF